MLNYKKKLESKNKKIEELKIKIKSFKLNNNLLSDALITNRTIETDLTKAQLTIKDLNELIIKKNNELNILKENNIIYQHEILNFDKNKNQLYLYL